MAERDVYIFGEVRETSVNKADGTKRMPRMTADGSFVTQDWVLAQLLEGRMFSINTGLISAVVASAGAVTATVPDVHVQIPSTVKIIPIGLTVTVDALVDDQDVEILALISNGVDTTPTGGTDLEVFNRNQASSQASKCKAQSDVTAITSPVTGREPIEFWRDGLIVGAKPAATNNEVGPRNTFKYSYLNEGPVMAAGGAELVLMIGKAATNYQATIVFVELDA